MQYNHNDNLPSIDELVEESNNLPSVDDLVDGGKNLKSIDNYFCKEEENIAIKTIDENLPSVDDYIEKVFEKIEEEENIEEDLSERDPIEYLKLLIEEVRNSIPEIPEFKYYDEEILHLLNLIENVRNEIPEPIEIPEIKYYDDDINLLVEKINYIRETILNLPEVKYYDEDISKLYYKIDDTVDSVDRKLNDISENIDVKFFESKIDADSNVNNKILDLKNSLKKDIDLYEIKILNLKKSNKEDVKSIKNEIEEISKNLDKSFGEKIEDIRKEYSSYDTKFDQYSGEIDKLNSLISNFPKVKYYDEDLKRIQKNISSIENSFKIELKEIQSIVDNIKSEQIELKEGLLNEPPEVENKDPLTPLNQNFATLEDLSSHYRLFINRVQQQLSTLGGGGETRLKYLDDIVGIQTNASFYDGKYLKYDHSIEKFVFETVSGGGGNSVWASNASGIHTTSNVGVGKTYPNYQLEVGYQGIAGTTLYVHGDARVTGILSIGQGTVTIDGNTNTITSGNVTISQSTITLGENVTLNSSSSGINTAPNILYVAKDGNDSNNGQSIDNAFLTIKAAVGIATTGTIIKVLAGSYIENNPIEIPPFISIVGNDLKTVTVLPSNSSSDIFHVRKGCYISNMTFIGHVSPAAAVAFPTSSIAINEGGGKWESPYIQNCTSNTTTGTGLRIDGNQAEGLKSMVCDSYTQYNQGGVGVAVTNEGFAQLVSVFTICCNEAITCYKGSQVDLTNSNSSFGTYGLVADGVSNIQFTGIVTSNASAAQDTVAVAITTSTKPYNGQVAYFGKLYQSVASISVSAGGTGYTATPTVTINSPTGPNGETAQAFATLSGDSVSEITIISSGSQYETAPNITISTPNIGVNTATAVASMSPIYYTINSSTPITSGISTLTLDENLINTVSAGTTAYFYQVSRIVATSHTFEYIGSGNNITTATPKNGGVTIQENEVITKNGGKVVYTSTDQSGNFRIGDGIQINQNTGTISGRAFTRSLFSEMTPFILALS